VFNLERYPPEALGILDEQEWDNVVQVRYERTKPQKGKGGLDGKGRVNPAISEKFMLELEKTVPLLAQSTIVDQLVWKDIVEFKFRPGGVSRPPWLLYPWPVLEELAAEYRKTLARISVMDEIDVDASELCIRTIRGICELPMDVALLKSSGIGRTVSKFVKECNSSTRLQVFGEPAANFTETPHAKLESVLHAWKCMAAKGGIPIKDLVGDGSIDKCSSNLSKARTCMCWRELFAALESYDVERRSSQGARMRERRQTLDRVRPKIVKVRHASSRQNSIINRQAKSAKPNPAKEKIRRLHMEANITSMRRARPIQPMVSTPLSASTIPSTGAGGFGAAVALATGQVGKGNRGRDQSGKRPATLRLVAGGKQMRIPDSKKAAINLQRFSK
jgi:hypothetical protein